MKDSPDPAHIEIESLRKKLLSSGSVTSDALASLVKIADSGEDMDLSSQAALAICEWMIFHQHGNFPVEKLDHFLSIANSPFGNLLAFCLMQRAHNPNDVGGRIYIDSIRLPSIELLLIKNRLARLAFYSTCMHIGVYVYLPRLCHELITPNSSVREVANAYSIAKLYYEKCRQHAQNRAEDLVAENRARAAGYSDEAARLATDRIRELIDPSITFGIDKGLDNLRPFFFRDWYRPIQLPIELLPAPVANNPAFKDISITDIASSKILKSHTCWAFGNTDDFIVFVQTIFQFYGSRVPGLGNIFAVNALAIYLQTFLDIDSSIAFEMAGATNEIVEFGGIQLLKSCYDRLVRRRGGSEFVLDFRHGTDLRSTASFTWSVDERLAFDGTRCYRTKKSGLESSHNPYSGPATGRLYSGSKDVTGASEYHVGYYFLSLQGRDIYVHAYWAHAVRRAKGEAYAEPLQSNDPEDFNISKLEACNSHTPRSLRGTRNVLAGKKSADDLLYDLSQLREQYLQAVAFEGPYDPSPAKGYAADPSSRWIET